MGDATFNVPLPDGEKERVSIPFPTNLSEAREGVSRLQSLDWGSIGREGLAEARSVLEARLKDDMSEQARELRESFTRLQRHADAAHAELAHLTDPAARAERLQDLEATLARRRDSLTAATLAYAGSDTANALDAALRVVIRIVVQVARAVFLGA